MHSILAVDIGGTFTDLAAYVPAQGTIMYAKSPTTYDNFADGVMTCIDQVSLDLADAAFFKHGTTLVINTLLERKGARTALVTTQGFRDILEIGRGGRAEPFDLFFRRHPVLVPRDLRFEVAERVDGQGNPIIELTDEALQELARSLREAGVESVAVSFLNAYRNPRHEERAVAFLGREFDQTFVTGGTELSREWREYERTSTAVANAYVGPRVRGYIQTLQKNLVERKFTGGFFLTGSNGGALSANMAEKMPLYLVESGPTAGYIGAAALAQHLSLDRVIAFDMGGTTAKCALIENGGFEVENRYYVGGYARGFPIQIPVVDNVEVGAGGGSIAWLDDVKGLHVGPQSAGSNPGPVAYGWGGAEPTITDANVVLGRLDPSRFLGGQLPLDAGAARSALRDRIATPLGLSGDAGLLHVASGIVSIAVVIMAGAIKRITVERGRDPRDYVLLAYGGAGPLHAVDLAREMHIPQVVIPPEPGNFSAIGMLLADVRHDVTCAFPGPVNSSTFPQMLTKIEALERELLAEVAAEVGQVKTSLERFAELRYRGQEHSVLTPISSVRTVEALTQVFDLTYRTRYGHSDPDADIEFVKLHVAAHGQIGKPKITEIPTPKQGQNPYLGTRRVVFPGSSALDTSIYARSALTAGFSAAGPAIIEEFGSTTVIGPQDSFSIDQLGQIWIKLGGL